MQDRSSPQRSPARQRETVAVVPSVDLERRALLSEFVTAGEQERKRLAEGIHDDSIQAMAALAMRLQMLRRTLEHSEQLASLLEAEQAVQLSIGRLRHLVFELHPPGLEFEGLSVALALALEAERTSPPDSAFVDELREQPTIEESAILFRVAQEALANVRAHAEASSVTVTLLERAGGTVLRVADDGRGFDPALAAPGSRCAGFAAMRARVALGCGTLHVESDPGGGTAVEAWLPHPWGFAATGGQS
jgi:signal transduction histidine kinase